ncbi:HXXEE domain-containing protein [Marinitenerispora sediminis]|uniref:HXXEE domain-containing protein n=1 Tax=Marinitenerispora sediminis TaxID=1931232 RepID=A0A368T0A4_9ACTN|nr:HXXEE domain-containing protein [Marinitenerispora sediminis]RCV48367.1 HXXEE domain-containing protein [Marinitenerispora sediminis]RCV49760.1 HXXEE domain-containing protein [Marinitenerispora sediminis]RCV52562.1 HXXEE domain-containing protein [Marinitenerispora sediminis]
MPEADEAALAEARAPAPGRLAALWALAVAALAGHNAEEWRFGMGGWISAHPWLPGSSLHADPTQLALALAIVTTAVFLIAAVAVVSRPAWSPEVLGCLSYALMCNGAGHLVLSAASWSLMPGVVTGVLVLLPVGLLTVRSLPPVRWTAPTVATTVIAAVGMVAGSLALADVLALVV